MDRLAAVKKLNAQLLAEMPDLQVAEIPDDLLSQRKLLRALMNVRPPMPLDAEFLKLQDEILSAEVKERGVVKVSEIPSVEKNLKIWQGDITRLDADAIVNAANSALLGCFVPLHGCIDNAIHSAAGLQLREECAAIMRQQGYEEPTGQAKITAGYNLPAKHVIHTVGPIIQGPVTEEDEQLLASCYRSCLTVAADAGLESIAFCCISTGEFHFPNQRAAEIAVRTVKDFLGRDARIRIVVFNVFKDLDAEVYHHLLDKR